MKKEQIYITPESLILGVETEGILCVSSREIQTSEKFEEYTPDW